MLTKDTQKIQEHVRAERQERVEDRTRKNLIDEIQSNTITVESDAGRDVTSVEAQMGRPLTAAAINPVFVILFVLVVMRLPRRLITSRQCPRGATLPSQLR